MTAKRKGVPCRERHIERIKRELLEGLPETINLPGGRTIRLLDATIDDLRASMVFEKQRVADFLEELDRMGEEAIRALDAGEVEVAEEIYGRMQAAEAGFKCFETKIHCGTE